MSRHPEPPTRINCAMKHVQREIQIRRCGRENYVELQSRPSRRGPSCFRLSARFICDTSLV